MADLNDINTMTLDEVLKDINFIKATEKLVGENTLGNEDTLNRGLKQFISFIVPKIQKLSSDYSSRFTYQDITQERVDELMGITQDTCPSIKKTKQGEQQWLKQ